MYLQSTSSGISTLFEIFTKGILLEQVFLPLLLLQRKSPTCRLQHKDRIINDQIEGVIMGQPKEYNSSLQKVVLNENYS